MKKGFNMTKKKIIVIVGPSGSGKTNLIEQTFKPEQVLRSLTTRSMRPGEVDGQNYLFTSNDAYNAQKANNNMIQTVEYDGNQYGVSKEEAISKLKMFDVVVVAVVIQSVKDYIEFGKENDIEIIPIFTSISKEMLIKHFDNRTESEEQKQPRIAKFEDEIQNKKYFDAQHILDMNKDDFGKSASEKLKQIIAK